MSILQKWLKKKEQKQLDQVSVGLETEKKTQTKALEKEVSTKTASTSTIAYNTIKKPLVSEKAGMAEKHSTYTFVVASNANKTRIKQALKELYGIMPTQVATMRMEGKQVRFGYTQGRRSDWKKAIVTLPKGQTIDIHEGV